MLKMLICVFLACDAAEPSAPDAAALEATMAIVCRDFEGKKPINVPAECKGWVARQQEGK